ncbi:MAG: hypothetical protein DSY83_06425 [Flavobacteriia bacterium]|nr:MAG: hypothetical protein DSY83_06425 [Flavobacteriia bacterium]
MEKLPKLVPTLGTIFLTYNLHGFTVIWTLGRSISIKKKGKRADKTPENQNSQVGYQLGKMET